MSLPSRYSCMDLINTSSLCLEHRNIFSLWARDIEAQSQALPKDSSFSELLESIPVLEDAGCLSLSLLALVLLQYPGPIPSFDVIRCYTKHWLALPEAAKAGHDEESKPTIQNTFEQICLSIGTLPSLFSSDSDTPALIDPTRQKFLTHQQLSVFIRNFSLPVPVTEASSKPAVALALPNGFLLGLASLAVSSYYTAAPLNISGGPSQFRSDVGLARPQCLLVLESDVEKLRLDEPWISKAGIQILLVLPQEDMTFEVRPREDLLAKRCFPPAKPNTATDVALILFTSGTSGTKKLVPITGLGLLTGVQCVIDSWGLTSEDTCLNMMPLNHVGGLVRNLFAPVLSGGSTILCPAFDPNQFWDILEGGSGTWYYASPSMHMSILAEAGLRGDSVSRCHLRLVCNAAGGLLPALAVRLKDTFKCTVLPSYGMTECMPISTPPLSYTLDRVGTSGVGCGPEITILDDSDNHLPSGQVGRISVRGGPTFPGYLKDGQIDKSAFNKDGWFDTGDFGSFDQEGYGYLYVTGRGKEVINRGGEIISPFEVEEAITISSQTPKSILYGRIKQVLAFSAPHEVLQEVVSVALVTSPTQPHLGRPDVRDLQTALKSSLHSSKWPIAVVYMDALPTSNNKLVRIKLAERMDMTPISKDTTLPERHFDAVCPPINSALSAKISKVGCRLDLTLVLRVIEKHLDPKLDAHVAVSRHDGTPLVYLAPKKHSQDETSHQDIIQQLQDVLRRLLDGYTMPSSISFLATPFPRDQEGHIDEQALHTILKEMKNSNPPPASETEQKIRKAFAEVLGIDVDEISSNSDFFDMGGESLSAGYLLSLLRRDIGVRIPVDKLFTSSKVFELCELVDQIITASSKPSNSPAQPMPEFTKTHSSTHPLILIVHALPIVVLYPMKMAFQWTVLMYALSSLAQVWNESNIASRFLALVSAMFISRASTQIISPICGIIFKWVVIGAYEEGMYPMWGLYHTRWWIVDKVLTICGKGVFRHLDCTRICYYRLLGAKIGKGVTIEKGTTLGEYDLLDIGDNVYLDRCICRPFAAEKNTLMYLGRITIGKNSSIGLKSHIAAGSVLPEGTFMGPNSSSYEMDDGNNSYRGRLPKSNVWLQLFCIFPIQIFVVFVAALPWMGGLFGIVMGQPGKSVDSVRTVITWWATPHRISFHYLAQALNVAVKPFIWFGLIVIIKKVFNIVCGPAKPKAAKYRTGRDNFRTQLFSTLVPYGSLKSLTKLFGTHYEFTSIAVRAMGGKVGRRVYWPGTGPSIQDFNLLDIGDDVVFGSRSHIITSDAVGSDVVKIGNGAMVADRVVLSPGANVGERTVLGSGAFIRRNQDCVPDSVWVGNRKGSALCLSSSNTSTKTRSSPNSEKYLEKAWPREDESSPSYLGSPHGNSIFSPLPSYPGSMRSSSASNSKFFSVVFVDEKSANKGKITLGSSSNSISSKSEKLSSSSPFGRAFYEGQAPYHVFGQFTIFLYSTFISIFVQVYWNIGTISTLILSRIINNTDQFRPRWYRPLKIYTFDVCIVSGLCVCLSLLSLGIAIAAKWLLLGRRKAGSYDWDKSSYCQRWQLFLTIEAIRRRCFGGNGVLGMMTGTHYCVLYFRLLGAKIGKDCALFAGGRPSLVFTEPDLLTLGDRVTTDDSSLVCHINSRGKFSLNELSVGDRSVLRSGSRLLSGARMGSDCVLLEHTLVMAGDEAEDGVTYQGWPADVFTGDRLKVKSGRS